MGTGWGRGSEQSEGVAVDLSSELIGLIKHLLTKKQLPDDV